MTESEWTAAYDKFVTRWEERLFQELLLAYHAHQDEAMLVRAIRRLPTKCRELAGRMFSDVLPKPVPPVPPVQGKKP